MKLIYFTRDSVHHYYPDPYKSGGLFITGVYIPNEKVVLGTIASAGFGSHSAIFDEDTVIYDLNKEIKFFDEIEPLEHGKVPDVDGVKYENIKEVEYNDLKKIKTMKDIIDDAKEDRESHPKIMKDIFNFIKEIRN